MFLDEIRIYAEGGFGGRGCVSFRREKCVPRGGPDGGNGGDGGSVWFEVAPNVSTFAHLDNLRRYKAKRGEHGRGSKETGARGEDITVPVPRGTLIYDAETGAFLKEMLEVGEKFLSARGGRGGRGNAEFATSTNRAPRKAEDGKPGEKHELRLELKLLADAGLVGFPNAGKSTLISRISSARSKVAPYPFTTLVPHLGTVLYGGWKSFVVADIPGIIEGAHKGSGLGVEFLKHIERTAVLVHLVDMSQTGRSPMEDIKVVNGELNAFHPSLSLKPQIIAPNKIDALRDAESLDEVRNYAKREGRDFCPISAATGEGIEKLIYTIVSRVEGNQKTGGDEFA